MNQIFQTYVFLIRDNGIYNRTELIVQKYQKVQKLLTSHSSTELNKTDFLCDYHKKITQVMPRFWGRKIKLQLNCFFSFNETFQQKKVFAKNLGIQEKRDPGPWEEQEP